MSENKNKPQNLLQKLLHNEFLFYFILILFFSNASGSQLFLVTSVKHVQS